MRCTPLVAVSDLTCFLRSAARRTRSIAYPPLRHQGHHAPCHHFEITDKRYVRCSATLGVRHAPWCRFGLPHTQQAALAQVTGRLREGDQHVQPMRHSPGHLCRRVSCVSPRVCAAIICVHPDDLVVASEELRGSPHVTIAQAGDTRKHNMQPGCDLEGLIVGASPAYEHWSHF